VSRIDPEIAPAATIERLDLDGYVAAIPGLAELLKDSVDGGASVNFVAGLTIEDAAGWWRDRTAQIANGTTTALVAVSPDGRIVGSTLLFRMTQPNAPHRAEIGKVLVHRDARRRGIGRALMAAIESLAREEGRWLLILDTQSGTDAEVMYNALGWQPFGVVPNHSLTTDGILSPTTFFWKDLR
jgi:GNAT superfamily N-acetyltransferase